MSAEKVKTRTLVPLVEELASDGYSLGQALKEVAESNGVNVRTLETAYRRHGGVIFERHGNSKLSQEDEEAVAFAVAGLSLANKSFPFEVLCLVVKKCFNITVTRTWGYDFLERHSDILKYRNVETIASKRVGDDIVVACELYTARVGPYLIEQRANPKGILNLDEARIGFTKKGKLTLKRIESSTKMTNNVLHTADKTIGSYIPVISATGEVICSFIVLKVKLKPDQVKDVPIVVPMIGRRSPAGSWPRYIACTAKGYLKIPTFDAIISILAKRFHQLYPGLKCFVFCDQLQCHTNATTISNGLQENAEMIFLPANTSYFSQPCDHAAIFGNIKKILRKHGELKGWAMAFTGKDPADDNNELLRAIFNAEYQVLKDNVIKKAFEETYLHPFKGEQLVAKAREVAAGKAELMTKKEERLHAKGIKLACKGTCGKKMRKNQLWANCTKCLSYRMCPRCLPANPEAVVQHEASCGV